MSEEMPVEETAVPDEAEQTAEEQSSEETPKETSEESTEETPEKEQTEDKQASEKTRRRRAQRRRQRELQQEREARIEAEKQAAYYRGLAESKVQPDGEPKRDDFEDVEDYIEAKTEWKVKQAEKPSESPKNIPEPPNLNNESYQNFESKGFEQYGDDFNEMLEAAKNQEFAATEVMTAAIFDSEMGPELAMHLYDNPTEAARIANLPAHRQVRELQGLEVKLKPKPQEKKVSQAPPPVNHEKGDSEPGTDLSKIKDTSSYIEMRKKQLGYK